MHEFNMGFVRAVQPNIEEYRRDKIPFVHRSLLNFTRNFSEPTNFVNSTLTADLESMGVSLGRFVINSTVGLLGIFDVASEIGLKRDRRDFGTTLGFWGVPEMGFFEVPIAGPKTTRDAVGWAGDAAMDPWNWVIGFWPAFAIGLVGGLLEFDENYDVIYNFQMNAIDSYASLKSLHLQMRQRRIDEVNSLFFTGRVRPNSWEFDMDMAMDEE